MPTPGQPTTTSFVYRALGRPLPSTAVEHPLATESACATLLETLTSDAPLIRVAGDARCEAIVCGALASAASRLRRRGVTVLACGEVFDSISPPARPGGDVVILLGAAFHEDLGDWLRPNPGQRVILVSPVEEWRDSGVEPDITIPADPAMDLDPIRAEWFRSAVSGAIVPFATALGCDINTPEADAAEVYRASTLTGTGWYAHPAGTWLARTFLDELVTVQPEFAANVRQLRVKGARFEWAVTLWERSCRNIG